MANKPSNVVLNFKMEGQVEYAKTVREINAIMNTAAKEYKNHVSAMGDDAKATDKLRAEKKKLEIQMDAAKKRTEMLRVQYEEMSKSTKTTTGQLTQMYNKLLDAERAETSLDKSMKNVNESLTDQSIETRDAKDELSKLGHEMALLEDEQKKLNSGFDLQNASLNKNASETERNELAQKQLKQQMSLTEKVVETLEQQLDQAKKAYGENSREVIQLETKLNGAKTTVAKFTREIEGIQDGAKKANSGMDTLKGGLQGLAGALPAAAITGFAESTLDTGMQLAMLEQQAKNAGLSLDDLSPAQDMFATVGQDVGQVTEALGNLTQAGYQTRDDIAQISEGISGAITKYGETFTSEGLAESINTTSQLGEVTGQLTDLLEKEGVNVESFNEKISGMATAEERANEISKLFADQGLNGMYQEYAKGNPEIIAAAEAQREQEAAMTELGNVIRPMVTTVSEFTTKLIQWANENPTLTKGIAIVTVGLGLLFAAAVVLGPVFATVAATSAAAGIGIGTMMLPILLVIGAIALIVAAVIGVIAIIRNWGAITDWLGDKFSQFTSWLIGKTFEMKNKFTDGFREMKDGAVDQFNSLRETASEVVSKIISFFTGLGSKLKFDIPKPKLPRFSLQGEFSLSPPSVPTIGIDWRANGAIFTQPTIFGQYGGRLQGAGDAGPEAALPLNDDTLGAIGRGIAKTMRTGSEIVINLTHTLDGRALSRGTYRYDLENQERDQSMKITTRGGI